MSGYFVAVEGVEGAGKSTLIPGLRAHLEEAGLDPVLVREPGGTGLAEGARRLLLDPDHRLDAPTELFLLLAARADLVGTVIKPALGAGRVVIADRYELSTLAYQVGGRGLERSRVLDANRLATGGLTPDLTLVLDVPVELGLARMRKAGKVPDRMEREAIDFHQRVAEAFRAANGAGIVHLDASRSPADVLAAAWKAVRSSLPETFRAGKG